MQGDVFDCVIQVDACTLLRQNSLLLLTDLHHNLVLCSNAQLAVWGSLFGLRQIFRACLLLARNLLGRLGVSAHLLIFRRLLFFLDGLRGFGNRSLLISDLALNFLCFLLCFDCLLLAIELAWFDLDLISYLLQALLPFYQLLSPSLVALSLFKHVITLDLDVLFYKLVLRKLGLAQFLKLFLVGNLQVPVVFYVLHNHVVSLNTNIELLLADMALE